MSKNKNIFTVDLGDLDLTDQQRTHISISICKAAASELASVGEAAGKVIVIPNIDVAPRPGQKGPIIRGLVARKLTGDISNLLKLETPSVETPRS